MYVSINKQPITLNTASAFHFGFARRKV